MGNKRQKKDLGSKTIIEDEVLQEVEVVPKYNVNFEFLKILEKTLELTEERFAFGAATIN